MVKEYVYLLSWDEICGDTRTEFTDKEENELKLPITCNDEELVAFVRKHNSDEKDPDMPWGTDWRGQPNEYGWRCADVVRGRNTALIEWRSDRNHLATTTIIWHA